MKPAIFLDRDGTLIEEVNFLHKPDQVRLTPGIAESVRRANQLSVPVIVVSNQSGVARGLFSESDVQVVHQHIDSLLAGEGVRIDAWFFCPHYPLKDGSAYDQICSCRKPGTGMFQSAAKQFPIHFQKSLMVGDKEMDLQAGRALGMACALVETGYGRSLATRIELTPSEYVFVNAGQAIRWFTDKLEAYEK